MSSMMELVGRVSELVRCAVKNYRLEGDRHEAKPVSVYEQYVPVERFDDMSSRGRYHPMIVVALRSVEEEAESEAELALTFAVYDEGDGGWRDLMNLVESVRIELLRTQAFGCYRLRRPLTTEFVERQPRPFWYAETTARYFLYQPEEERGTINGRV